MYAGEVVEYGTCEEIFDHPQHPYTIGLLKSIPRLNADTDTLYTIKGVVPGMENMPEGCRFSNRCPHCMKRCQEEHPELADDGGHKVRCWLMDGERREEVKYEQE